MNAEPSSEYSPAKGTGNGHPQHAGVSGKLGDEVSHVPIHYSARTTISVTVFAVLIAIGLSVVFFLEHRSRLNAAAALQLRTTLAGDRAISVDVVRVQRAASNGVLNLPGDARSFYETTIFGRTNGYVSKWFVDIGDHVKANQVLATIETPELDDQLNESKANLAQLNAQANVAATTAQYAKVTFDRWEAAAPEGAVSQQERDGKKADLDSAVAKVDAAKSEVNLGHAQVQRLETLEKFKAVIAPFDGVITQRYLDIGSLVTAGSTTNTTPLYTISQYDRIRVFVEVPQPAVEDIHVGMQAGVTTQQLPGQSFDGTVDRTASSIDPRSRTLKVEVLVPNPKLILIPGMYVQVNFQTSHAQTPLRIPAAALAFGPEGPQVAVVGNDKRLRFRPVTIARDMGDFVEIASGISEGDMVALNVGSQVNEGEEVEVNTIELAPTVAPSRPALPAPAVLNIPTAAVGTAIH
jgi:RND family efflux transporter MFP subunit